MADRQLIHRILIILFSSKRQLAPFYKMWAIYFMTLETVSIIKRLLLTTELLCGQALVVA